MAGGPRIGETWAGYRIEAQIGEGGYGRVFAAWDPDLERRVAIKVLHRDGMVVDDVTRERFLRESRLAAGLDHPRIVPIHAAAEHVDPEHPDRPGIPYIVMRYVDGGDLRAALRDGPLGTARTTAVVSQVADALDRAHRSGLVHRDVKPANVLCAADSDDVYLGDFGISRAMEQSADLGLTTTGAVPASPHYAAPEQLVPGAALGPATDVYALACTAFECLTGRVPFPGANHVDVSHQHLHASRPAVTRHRPDLPAGIDDVLARGMAVDPADRYATAGELAEALAAVAAGTSGRPGVVPPAAGPDDGDATRAVDVATPHADTTVVGDDPERVGDATQTDAGATRVAPAGDGDAPPPTRSVFDPPPAGIVPAPPTQAPLTPAPPAQAAAPPVGPPAHGARGVVEVDWDGWDEEGAPRSRTPWIVGAALAVAVLLVAALVVRAVNTDADLDAAAATTTTAPPTTEAPPEPPRVEDLRALLPAGLAQTCVPPADDDGDPLVARLVCPRDGTPELVTYALFTDDDARDDAFADVVGTLELDPARSGECALADDVVHTWEGERGPGRLACRGQGSRVDLAWTEAGGPVLATAGGPGFYGDGYRWWSALVGRSDAAFPLPVEQALLDDLPDAALPDAAPDGCRRDIDLTDQAPGVAAIVCEPEDGGEKGAARVVSWVRFADGATMDDWIAARRAGLDDLVFAESTEPCTEDPGKARKGDDEDDRPAPEAGYARWEGDGRSGRVLCFVNSSGQNVVFWTEDDRSIGGIAVSQPGDGDLRDLLRWWVRDAVG